MENVIPAGTVISLRKACNYFPKRSLRDDILGLRERGKWVLLKDSF